LLEHSLGKLFHTKLESEWKIYGIHLHYVLSKKQNIFSLCSPWKCLLSRLAIGTISNCWTCCFKLLSGSHAFWYWVANWLELILLSFIKEQSETLKSKPDRRLEGLRPDLTQIECECEWETDKLWWVIWIDVYIECLNGTWPNRLLH